jgi:hypothetical protein
VVSFPQVSPLRPCMHLSSPPYVPHVLPISVFLTSSPEWYLVRSTKHEAPYYVVFSTPLLPHRRQEHRQIFKIFNTYTSSAATMPTRTRLNVTLYVHWMSCSRLFYHKIKTVISSKPWQAACRLHCVTFRRPYHRHRRGNSKSDFTERSLLLIVTV